MMKQIDIGTIWVSDDTVAKIEAHREQMITAHPEKESMLREATFGEILMDYLQKNVR